MQSNTEYVPSQSVAFTETLLSRSLVIGLLKWFVGVAPALKVVRVWRAKVLTLHLSVSRVPPTPSRELLLLASTSTGHEILIHNRAPLWQRTCTHALSHIQSVLGKYVAGCAAIHLLLPLCLSLSPCSPLPPFPLPLCPIQSLSRLPGVIRSPPADQSQPHFLIQRGPSSTPPSPPTTPSLWCWRCSLPQRLMGCSGTR